jgi:hypothetical protein
VLLAINSSDDDDDFACCLDSSMNERCTNLFEDDIIEVRDDERGCHLLIVTSFSFVTNAVVAGGFAR